MQYLRMAVLVRGRMSHPRHEYHGNLERLVTVLQRLQGGLSRIGQITGAATASSRFTNRISIDFNSVLKEKPKNTGFSRDLDCLLPG
jgi:hypothetical protein